MFVVKNKYKMFQIIHINQRIPRKNRDLLNRVEQPLDLLEHFPLAVEQQGVLLDGGRRAVAGWRAVWLAARAIALRSVRGPGVDAVHVLGDLLHVATQASLVLLVDLFEFVLGAILLGAQVLALLFENCVLLNKT